MSRSIDDKLVEFEAALQKNGMSEEDIKAIMQMCREVFFAQSTREHRMRPDRYRRNASGKIRLDEVDVNIIQLMQDEPTISKNEIARQCFRDPSGIKQRIRCMIEAGIVSAGNDPGRINYHWIVNKDLLIGGSA